MSRGDPAFSRSFVKPCNFRLVYLFFIAVIDSKAYVFGLIKMVECHIFARPGTGIESLGYLWYSDHCLYAPTQLETPLQYNVVSHWLCAYTKWSLIIKSLKNRIMLRYYGNSTHFMLIVMYYLRVNAVADFEIHWLKPRVAKIANKFGD